MMDIRPPERAAAAAVANKPRPASLWPRMTAWGLGAALALGTLAVVVQSRTGSERLALTLAGVTETEGPAPELVAEAPPQTDPRIETLEEHIAELSQDRQRLVARLAALESGFQDLTGSVRKQVAAAATPATPPPVPAPVEVVERPEPMVVAIAPPMINPLATPPAGIASIMPVSAAAPAAEPAPDVAAPAPQPDAELPKLAPLPEVRVASAPAVAAIPRPAPARPHAEYGVEIAMASDIDALRARWTTLKANFGPLLVGLSPVAVRDRRAGKDAVRLVAGPLPSLAAARQLCGRIVTQHGDCAPARINPADVIQH